MGRWKITPFTEGTVHFPYSHCLHSQPYILEVPNMDYATFIKLTQNGTYSPVGFNQPTHLNVSNHT